MAPLSSVVPGKSTLGEVTSQYTSFVVMHFGCSLQFTCPVFVSVLFLCQWKDCVRVSKQAWWTWLYGWGPALTIPVVMHPRGGIRFPGLSSKSFPNKNSYIRGMGSAPVRMRVCYIVFQNEQVRLAQNHTDGNFMFCGQNLRFDRPFT